MAIKVGSTVRVKTPVIVGTVNQLTTDGENFGFLVGFTDEHGNGHERFFNQDQLEEVPADEAASAADSEQPGEPAPEQGAA